MNFCRLQKITQRLAEDSIRDYLEESETREVDHVIDSNQMTTSLHESTIHSLVSPNSNGILLLAANSESSNSSASFSSNSASPSAITASSLTIASKFNELLDKENFPNSICNGIMQPIIANLASQVDVIH